jgi:flavin reductase ActVB
VTTDVVALETVSPDVFKNAMACLPAPVSILTCYDEEGEPRGLTISALTSLSLDPPLLLLCLDRRSTTHPHVVAARRFCVHLPAPGQEWLVRKFAGPADQRFAGVAVEPGPAPALSVVQTRLTCEQYGVRDGGDHTILLGRVVDVYLDRGPAGTAGAAESAMVWHQRGFGRVEPV